MLLASPWKGGHPKLAMCLGTAPRAQCGQVCGYAYVSMSCVRSSVSVAVGGQLVQAHLAKRSLLSCSDEAALSHKELCFHSPCIHASEAQLRPPAHLVRHQAWQWGQRLLVLGRKGSCKGNVTRQTRGLAGLRREARWLQASSIVFSTCLCLGQELTSS